MLRSICFATLMVSLSAQATHEVQVTDDRQAPVQSVIFLDGHAQDRTNVQGIYDFTKTPCPPGTIITATAVTHEADYLPSTKVYCLNSEPRVVVVLTRKTVPEHIYSWYKAAVEQRKWPVAAIAASELHGLGLPVKFGEVAGKEGAKYATLRASALALRLDPQKVIRFDRQQSDYVMTPAFANAVRQQKRSHGVLDASPKLNNDFFRTITKVTPEQLRYAKPDFQKAKPLPVPASGSRN